MNLNPFAKPSRIPIAPKEEPSQAIAIIPQHHTPIPIEPKKENESVTENILMVRKLIAEAENRPQETGNDIIKWVQNSAPTKIPIEPRPQQNTTQRHQDQVKFNASKGGKEKEPLKKRRFARKYEKGNGHLRSELESHIGEAKLDLRLDLEFDNEAQALKALHQLSAAIASCIESLTFGIASEHETTAIVPHVNNQAVIIERRPIENIPKPQIIKATDKTSGFTTIVTELDSRLMSEKAKREWCIKDDFELDPMVETKPKGFETKEVAQVDEEIEWAPFEDDKKEDDDKYEIVT